MSDEDSELIEHEEEIILLLLQWRRKRRPVRLRHQSRKTEGEFVVLQQMRAIDKEMRFKYFRMSANHFDELAYKIRPFTSHVGTHSSPVELKGRLAVTLKILASGGSQQSIAASYRLRSATVSCIVSGICRAIRDALNEELVGFPSGASWNEIVRDFWRLWNIPNFLGSIDGKHVIKAPPSSGSDYFDYKPTHSVVLMAVYNALYNVIMVKRWRCF